MSETYDVMFESAAVGSAQVKKEGLYYCFSCRCCLPDTGLYRIHVIFSDKREDLGICVPMGNAFGMDKKLSAKHMGAGEPVFELLPKDWKPYSIPAVTEPDAVLNEEASAEVEMMHSTTTEEPDLPEQINPPMISEPADETFIPVSADEPFDDLDRFENAVLAEHDNQIGIIIREEK